MRETSRVMIRKHASMSSTEKRENGGGMSLVREETVQLAA